MLEGSRCTQRTPQLGFGIETMESINTNNGIYICKGGNSMANKKKENKSSSKVKDIQNNGCPVKDGDNCKVPGVYSDSDPIGGS
jgi:hypothetical protein